jgi:hypothetical protein
MHKSRLLAPNLAELRWESNQLSRVLQVRVLSTCLNPGGSGVDEQALRYQIGDGNYQRAYWGSITPTEAQ